MRSALTTATTTNPRIMITAPISSLLRSVTSTSEGLLPESGTQIRRAQRSDGTLVWSSLALLIVRRHINGEMVVNVCPAATTSAPPERIWRVLTTPERFSEWNDATFVSAEPPGAVKAGQVIHFTAPALGRKWPLTMEVRDMDPQSRWIDLLVRLPFGIENHEHITLTQTKEGGTLVRFN
jgi:Activator of Hsp90 ATPase homolog 1-like protein